MGERSDNERLKERQGRERSGERGSGERERVAEGESGWGETTHLPWLHVRHHAEIQIAQLAVGHREQVTRMRVRVKEAVFQELPERTLDQGVDVVGGVDTHRRDGVSVCSRRGMGGGGGGG
jgi:hypothetical protein